MVGQFRGQGAVRLSLPWCEGSLPLEITARGRRPSLGFHAGAIFGPLGRNGIEGGTGFESAVQSKHRPLGFCLLSMVRAEHSRGGVSSHSAGGAYPLELVEMWKEDLCRWFPGSREAHVKGGFRKLMRAGRRYRRWSVTAADPARSIPCEWREWPLGCGRRLAAYGRCCARDS